MTTVSWQLDLVVLYDILLNDCVSRSIFQFRLFKGFGVEITLWDVAIVAWNVTCHLGGSHSKLVNCVCHLSGI